MFMIKIKIYLIPTQYSVFSKSTFYILQNLKTIKECFYFFFWYMSLVSYIYIRYASGVITYYIEIL